MGGAVAKAILSYKKNIELATVDPQINIDLNEMNKAIASSKEKIYGGITFKVQLAAGSKKLDPKPYNFKGLTDISRHLEGKMFKYYYGSTSDYSKVLLMKKFARKKGYPSCYVVAFKKGKKIKLSDVLKSEDK